MLNLKSLILNENLNCFIIQNPITLNPKINYKLLSNNKMHLTIKTFYILYHLFLIFITDLADLP